MEREYKVGAVVIYTDEFGKAHNALVNQWWDHYGKTNDGKPLGCNLLFVSDDEAKEDNYGRQIARDTSVVHKSIQPANGRHWKWPDE